MGGPHARAADVSTVQSDPSAASPLLPPIEGGAVLCYTPQEEFPITNRVHYGAVRFTSSLRSCRHCWRFPAARGRTHARISSSCIPTTSVGMP